MTEMTGSSESNPHYPSARKRQRTEADGAASRFSQEQERQSSGALPGQAKAADRGQAKVAEVTGSRRPKAAEKQTAKKDNPQPRPSKTPTENKAWCNLSERAQSRHMRNDVRARIRAMIPGHTKISENGVMLQVAERIRQLEREIDSTAIHLERLLQSSEGTAGAELENNLKDQNVPSASASKQSSPIPAGQNGHDVLRSVLPQPSKAKGSRLLQIALEYLTELTAESDKLKQGYERQVYIQAPMMDTNSTPNHKSHLITSESAEFGGCVRVPSMDATSVPNRQFTHLAAESDEESAPEGPGKL